MKAVLAAAAMLAGCGGGSPTSTATTSTGPATTAPTVTGHLVNAGKEIGAAATLAASKAQPYIDAGIEKGKEGVHTAAVWVEEKTRSTTATAPATSTMPATAP